MASIETSTRTVEAGLSRHPDAGLSLPPDPSAGCHPLTVEIGGLPIRLRAPDAAFRALLAERYSSFLRPESRAEMEFDLQFSPPDPLPAEEKLEVSCEQGRWQLSRGEFRASFDLRTRRGCLAFVPNPYSVDTLLRIVHSLLLAPAGGLLLHASGGIRGGRGVLFSGVSGAGKTTIARLAPPDVQLLTDEISYLRRAGDGFRVYGTPFSGELGIQGEDVSAPLAAIYLIEHGASNRLERVAEVEAVRRLMRNTLFFAQEKRLVADVFSTVCELARRVPIYRLEFLPDARVWEMLP
ncbi:MAG TPA: hypothetical protein VJW51_09255 [Candidatus Acidoferrales bacterium]|nr:hypothetical protein [Candidatus Acidoferrales bacterium]